MPAKFEAGTPPIAEVIGLGAALDYVESAWAFDAIAAWDEQLLSLRDRGAWPRSRASGSSARRGEKASVLSFVLEGVHPHDVGTVLDDEGIAVRAGHHCAQPVMRRFGVPATARASFAFYNTPAEVEALARGLERVRTVFA